MKIVITLIELKTPWHFFSLSRQALYIMLQLKKTNYLDFKKTGVWTKHYTMTSWKNETDMQTFARSGAHLKAMQNSARIAKEIHTLTIDRETLPDWTEAKKLLEEKGKVIRY